MPIPSPLTFPAWRRSLLSLVLFVLTLLGAAVLIQRQQQQRASEADAATAHAIERTLLGLQGQLAACGTLLRSVQALFLANDHVDAERFARFHDVLRPRESFAGLQAIVMARRSAPGEPLAYITELVAPLAGNERVVGLDVVSQPANLVSVERSRDTDMPVMSASFRLIQRSGFDEPIDGLVMRIPAFSAGRAPLTLSERRARELGSIGVSFRVSELIHAGLAHSFDPRYQVTVTDISDGQRTLLYDSHQHGRTAAADPQAAPALAALHFGGRVWEIALQPVLGASGDTLAWLSAWALAVIVATLLALLTWSLVSRREHALQLADTLSRRYRESEARFRALNDVLPVAVVLTHADGRLDYVNESGRRLLGLGTGDPAAHRLADFAEPAREATATLPAPAEGPLDAVHALRAHTGRRFWATISACPLELAGEAMTLSVIADVSDLRDLTQRLAWQASHDPLTGLINRREFEHRLQRALVADGGYRCAGLLYVDLDQFKLVNDVSGHLAGDQLLVQLGNTLRAVLDPEDVLSRLGGDEFGVLVAGSDREDVLRTAERVRRAIDAFKFSWEGRAHGVTASIGAILLDPDRPRGLREVLSLADTACFLAKEGGRNRIHQYAEDDLVASRRLREMEWVTRLRWALAEDRFVLFYQELQPLKAVHPAREAHFELLLRLRDENDELVLPGAFVPAAERFGLMPQLDRWVVRTALRDFSRLHPAGDGVAVCAINLSATTMEDESFPAFVLAELKRSGVAAERLCFEVTETAAVANMSRVIDLIQRLRALGCRFALDDFGAGMSSFGYLKNMPVDFIKIDGSFIREIETDPMSYSIVRAVTDIGHQMGAEVIAEFVNSARTRDLLRGLGVDYVQGFAIHQPVQAGSATRLAAR